MFARSDGSAVRMARLVFSPGALPHAALNVPILPGIKGGFVGWFLLSGLFLAPAAVVGRTFSTWNDCALAAVAGGVVGGAVGSIVMMTLVLLLAPISEDENSICGRAQLNVWLLLPFCALGPMAVWAFFAVVADPHVEVWSGRSAWMDSPVARALGSPVWLIVFGIAMLVATQVGAWQVRRRLASGVCIGCGYLLTGLSKPRCPECGRAALPGQPIEQPTA